MCGRFSQHFTWAELRDYYNIIDPLAPNLEPRYNIGRMQKAMILRPAGRGLYMTEARFELVPHWWKKPIKEKKFSTFNARSEKVLTGESKSFKPAWVRGDVGILPVSGFYEWPRPAKKGQAPFFITATDAPFLSLACLWVDWDNPETGKQELTFSILTTEPNEVMDSIPHHRCPVIITKEEEFEWFNTMDRDDTAVLLKTPDAAIMKAERVSPYVNKIGNEGPECIA